MCFFSPLAIAWECNLIEAYLLERSCLEKSYKHINLASVSTCQYQVSAEKNDVFFLDSAVWKMNLGPTRTKFKFSKSGEQMSGQGIFNELLEEKPLVFINRLQHYSFT